MYLHEVGGALLRRWYVTIFCLALAAGGTWWVWERTPVSYEASARAVLVPPTTAVVKGANPYLFMGSLDQALSVVLVRMNSEEVVGRVLASAPEAAYTIVQDPATTGPIMLITATGATPEQTVLGLDTARKQVEPQLTQLQDQLKVPKNARITMLSIAQDATATELAKDRQRLAIVAGCAGLALSFLVVALADRAILGVRRRRRARRARRAAEPALAPAIDAVPERDAVPAVEPAPSVEPLPSGGQEQMPDAAGSPRARAVAHGDDADADADAEPRPSEHAL